VFERVKLDDIMRSDGTELQGVSRICGKIDALSWRDVSSREVSGVVSRMETA